MHPVMYILLLASASLAHYMGYESRNLIERDEPYTEMEGLVECPVCENTDSWLLSQEKCDIIKDNKRFKKCPRGIYVNEKCGNRKDCYRGPGDFCTEKMDYDIYGQKCAHGFYCHRETHTCIGMGHTVDHLYLLLNRLYRYPIANDGLLNKSALLLA